MPASASNFGSAPNGALQHETPVWIAHADAWTCLGHGSALHEALRAGRSGLRPVAEAYPGVEAVASAGLVGTLEEVSGEVRLPAILAGGLARLVPPELWEADLIVGACSLGDLAGPDAGMPRCALERALRLAHPGLALPPVQLVSSACSSGTDALGLGAAAIALGLADVVAVLAFDSLGPGKLVQHIALGTHSRERARPFDVARSGTSFGEAMAVVLLANGSGIRRLGLQRCVRVAGFGMSGDAHDVVAPHPEGSYAAQAIERALGGVDPITLGYVNAHGSGTLLNDRAECAALRLVLGARATEEIHLGSTKGAVGHTLGATGLVEVVVACHALSDGIYPPTAGLENVDPALCWSVPLVARQRVAEECHALSVTFGFGGVNSAVLLEAVCSGNRSRNDIHD